MQTYYEAGYAYALEKLGMHEKEAKGFFNKLISRFGGGAKADPSKVVAGGKEPFFREGSRRAGKGAVKGKGGTTVESATKPAEKPPVDPNKPGFLSKYKWPLVGAGALGAAGLGGYAYLRSRDPMGSSQLPMGYGAPGSSMQGGFSGY